MTVMTKPNKRDVKKSTPVSVMSATVEAVTAAAGDVVEPELSYRELQAKAKSLGLKANGSTEVLKARIEEGG